MLLDTTGQAKGRFVDWIDVGLSARNDEEWRSIGRKRSLGVRFSVDRRRYMGAQLGIQCPSNKAAYHNSTLFVDRNSGCLDRISRAPHTGDDDQEARKSALWAAHFPYIPNHLAYTLFRSGNRPRYGNSLPPEVNILEFPDGHYFPQRSVSIQPDMLPIARQVLSPTASNRRKARSLLASKSNPPAPAVPAPTAVGLYFAGRK